MNGSKRIRCPKCERDDFKSERGLSQHDSKVHPYIPPPPPATTTERMEGGLYETHTLLNGTLLQPGDTFYHVVRYVAREITRTEGLRSVRVVAEVVKRIWQKEAP